MNSYQNRKRQLGYLQILNRENHFHHNTYEEELSLYLTIREGSSMAVEEAKRMFTHPNLGTLSKNPLRNRKYLFVCSTTLATRQAIEGGLDSETAYNISDLFINKMDLCQTEEEIFSLHAEMVAFFSASVAEAQKDNQLSKGIRECRDYIDFHLHEKISVAEIAKNAGFSANYLSCLFRKETGQTISGYIREQKIKVAENMLRFSDYPYAEIAATLAFSSQSHFNRVFKETIGCTPAEYRRRYYWKKTAGRQGSPSAVVENDLNKNVDSCDEDQITDRRDGGAFV